jgi:hypothetical protein
MFDVCALRFPTGAVGAFKLALHEDIAKLFVDDGATSHGISEMSVDPALSTEEMAIALLLRATEASAHRVKHFEVLMRCELLQEGLIDADAFRCLAAWIAMRGIVQRAMDRAT